MLKRNKFYCFAMYLISCNFFRVIIVVGSDTKAYKRLIIFPALLKFFFYLIKWETLIFPLFLMDNLFFNFCAKSERDFFRKLIFFGLLMKM